MERLTYKACAEKLKADIEQRKAKGLPVADNSLRYVRLAACKEEGKMCLRRQEVLSSAEGKALSVDELCDKVIKKIAGRYFFSEDYTLEDMIAAEVAGGHLRFDRDTQMLSRP